MCRSSLCSYSFHASKVSHSAPAASPAKNSTERNAEILRNTSRAVGLRRSVRIVTLACERVRVADTIAELAVSRIAVWMISIAPKNGMPA